MTKKGKTAIFMICATIFNLILMVVFFFLFFLLLFVALPNIFPAIENIQAMSFVLPLLWFGGSIVLSFLIYSKMIKWASVKFNFEENLDPIFTPKKNRRERGE